MQVLARLCGQMSSHYLTLTSYITQRMVSFVSNDGNVSKPRSVYQNDLSLPLPPMLQDQNKMQSQVLISLVYFRQD